MKIAGYETHPAADLFPMFESAELDKLATDIRERGLLHPVVLHEEKILDGRNRLRACKAAGVDPRFTTYKGKDAIGYVVASNLVRRHLDESQRAMVGARIKSLYEQAAKARQAQGGKDKGRANLPEAPRPREEAAAVVNVSPRSVQDAVKVLVAGSPALIAAVDQGRIPVSVAAKMAVEARTVQDALVARVESEGAKAKQLVTELHREQMLAEIADGAKKLEPLEGQQPRPLIYADPPWSYDNTSSAGAVADEYQTMPLADICAMKVPATPDAVLFMWATSPLLPEAMQVISAWGFTYKASMIWDKGMGTGNWVLNCHELLLIAVRGDMPCPAPENRPKSVVQVARGKHSEKPERFAEIIKAMYPAFGENDRFEMFGRKPREGFTVWGNQAA